MNTPNDTRAYWVATLERIAAPVLDALADGRLKATMPVEEKPGANRAPATHLEALGRTLMGVAPWLELAPDGTPEGKKRASLAERARASYFPGRSGDLIVALKPRVTPIPDPTKGYVATHGSFWDYDRRVPILFWWKSAQQFEQPLGVETVDIMPTLASFVGLTIPPGEVDGRCLDLDPGTGSALLQALVGGVALVAAVVAHRWHQLRSWFAGRRTSADTHSREQ